MSDPNKLDSVEPIKSVEELEDETGGASTSTDGQDGQQDENPSLLGAVLNPFLSSSQDGQQDGATAAPSETTENSEG